uniref:Histone-lysine N-methyltransferase 2D n=1 Tax=Brachionus koreanus TaxID=1199090 RepID=A0A4Y6EQY1_9BILA|nr:histone-lysine N-methyltransferase 2D [Brachionus koreanus]
MERENKKKKLFRIFKNKKENSFDFGTKGKYRKKDLESGQSRNLPLRRIIDKRNYRENIYDEIGSIDESFEIMSENEIELSSPNKSEEKRIKHYEKFEQINEYDSLENIEMNDETKKSGPKVNFEIKEMPSIASKGNLDTIKSSSLENINMKARGRSKSAFVPNFNKQFSSEPHHLKRRGILDAITKNMEAPNNLTERRSSVFVKDERERRSSVFLKKDDISIISSEDRSENNMMKDIQEFQKKHNMENSKINEGEKEPNKMAPGFSIIYGLILCITGIFVSLDSNAGNLGNYRLISTLFYSYLYITGIIGITIVYFDYNKYINALYNLFESKNMNQPAVFSRKKSHTTKNEDIYATFSMKSNESTKEENTYMQSINVENEHERNLVDFSQKGFSGYLVDRNQPFNLFLTVGIGAFCIATLLQCCIGMSEAIENFIFGKINCTIETNEGIVSLLQFIFICFQFSYIILRLNIVICRNSYWSHLFSMHLAMTNLIVWFRYILIETIDEYYENILHEAFEGSLHRKSFDSYFSDPLENANLTDCFDSVVIKKSVLKLKPYLYPVTIEFSVSCATLYLIIWYKTNKRDLNCLSLPPKKRNFKEVGVVETPFSNLFIMLDCTKTIKGLLFGILIFVLTILSSIFFFVYRNENPSLAKLITEISEIILLLIALIIAIYAYRRIKKHYNKYYLPTNMFDVVLEIFSLGGVFAYNINSFIAVFYGLTHGKEPDDEPYILLKAGQSDDSDLTNNITLLFSALLQIIQSSIQTLLILECLRRYASDNSSYARKPGRELITILLIINICLWIIDTLSGKRYTVKDYLIDYFGTLKWSIINAFSAPIAIFYRFHSSVCLSDIWSGLYYGELEDNFKEMEGKQSESEYCQI